MNDRSEDTTPETPDAKRLSMPSLELPKDRPATPEDFMRAAANAMVSIAANLEYLRLETERRHHQEAANEKAIEQLENRVESIEKRVATLEAAE